MQASVVVAILFLTATLLVPIHAQQKCSGTPLSYNGLPCASTTRYTINTEGACGCGTNSNNSPFSWQSSGYTAAGSQLLFDAVDTSSSWCGIGCGNCFKLTPTGGYIAGQGLAPSGDGLNPVVFMITNLCPYAGNEQWCPQVGGTDDYGYSAHFDLGNTNNQIYDTLDWNNPEVTYEQVDCNTASTSCASSGYPCTPTNADWATCICDNPANYPSPSNSPAGQHSASPAASRSRSPSRSKSETPSPSHKKKKKSPSPSPSHKKKKKK